MKSIVLSFALLVLSTTSFAQGSKFQQGMQANLVLFDSIKTPDDYVSLAATFERIADAEKTQWLPYYYAALATILRGFSDPKADKDAVAGKAEALIAKAEAIEPENAEIFLLKSMNSTLHMLVDPQSRWQQYGAAVTEYREKAKQLDPNNPRVYYLEGQNIFGTPKEFGGGKDKAKPLFAKSLELFKTYKPAGVFYPNWGQKTTEQMLQQVE
jgi:Flp pilus assembly protein TadD